MRAWVVMGQPYVTGAILFFAGQSVLPSRYQLGHELGPRVWLLFLASITCCLLLLALLPFFDLARGRSIHLLEQNALQMWEANATRDYLTEAVGDFSFVKGRQGTLYNGFRLVPVPREHPECQLHIERAILHPLGGQVEYCYLGLATRGPTEENLRAGRRPPKVIFGNGG